MLLNNDFIHTIQNLVQPGYLAIINDFTKKVYLRPCSNVAEALMRILKEIKDNTFIEKEVIEYKSMLQFCIHGLGIHQSMLKLHYKYYEEYYRNRGYTSYRLGYTPVEYTVRTTIETDYKVYIRLVNRRNDSFIVGIFNNLNEAKVFVDECYSNSVKYLVYALNDLTKEHYRIRNRVYVE